MSFLSIAIPPPIQVNRHAVNGMYPEVAYHADLVRSLNHCVAFRRKLLWHYAVPLTTAGGTSGVAWRGYFHTGRGCLGATVRVVLGLDDHAAAVDPYLGVTIKTTGGATAAAMGFHGGANQAGTSDAPEEWIPQTQSCELSADTSYTLECDFQDNVRVLSVTIHEAAVATVDEDLVSDFEEWEPAAGSPIYSIRPQKVLAAVGGMVRRNKGIRADWVPSNGTARTRSSATPANLIDGSTTGTPTANTFGYSFYTQYRNTVSATTVPIVMAVYGSVNGTGHVYLRDTSGNDAADVSVIGTTPGWFTAAGTLSVGTGQKYDLMFAGTGVHNLSVNAVSIFEKGT